MKEALPQGGAFFLWLKGPFYRNILKFFPKIPHLLYKMADFFKFAPSPFINFVEN